MKCVRLMFVKWKKKKQFDTGLYRIFRLNLIVLEIARFDVEATIKNEDWTCSFLFVRLYARTTAPPIGQSLKNVPNQEIHIIDRWEYNDFELSCKFISFSIKTNHLIEQHRKSNKTAINNWKYIRKTTDSNESRKYTTGRFSSGEWLSPHEVGSGVWKSAWCASTAYILRSVISFTILKPSGQKWKKKYKVKWTQRKREKFSKVNQFFFCSHHYN